MREHKHYPVKGGAIHRIIVFFCAVIYHRMIDWDTETASCCDCGKLLRIPKADFLLMIRQNPHYGIFLSKILAQRLVKQTTQTMELKKQLNEVNGGQTKAE
jgi:hypothetical protein